LISASFTPLLTFPITTVRAAGPAELHGLSCRVAIDRVKLLSDIDLAVSECRLPDMSGVDVIKEIEDIAL
jgi:CheY-like chemotaxis protein